MKKEQDIEPAPGKGRGDQIRYLIAGGLIWWGVAHQLTMGADAAEPPEPHRLAVAGCAASPATRSGALADLPLWIRASAVMNRGEFRVVEGG